MASLHGLATNGSVSATTESAPATPVTVTETVTVSATPATVKAKRTTVTKTKRVTVTVTPPVPEAVVPDVSGGGGSSTYYDNCSDARAAGAAPVHRGEPGYGSHLDRDGDGVGCE